MSRKLSQEARNLVKPVSAMRLSYKRRLALSSVERIKLQCAPALDIPVEFVKWCRDHKGNKNIDHILFINLFPDHRSGPSGPRANLQRLLERWCVRRRKRYGGHRSGGHRGTCRNSACGKEFKRNRGTVYCSWDCNRAHRRVLSAKAQCIDSFLKGSAAQGRIFCRSVHLRHYRNCWHTAESQSEASRALNECTQKRLATETVTCRSCGQSFNPKAVTANAGGIVFRKRGNTAQIVEC